MRSGLGGAEPAVARSTSMPYGRAGNDCLIDCGKGADIAYVDAIDVVRNCELINPKKRVW